MKAFAATWRALRGLYDELFLYIWLSVLWWVGVVLILPAGPATLALQKVANRSANHLRVDSGFFWGSLRENIGTSWLLFGGNIIALVGVAVNIAFYGNRAGWFLVIAVAWIWVELILLLMGQYLFPLYCQQDDKRITLLLRNALILAFRYPLFSLLLVILQLGLLVVSILVPIFLLLLAPAMIALIANYGMTYALQEMGLAPPPPDSSH